MAMHTHITYIHAKKARAQQAADILGGLQASTNNLCELESTLIAAKKRSSILMARQRVSG